MEKTLTQGSEKMAYVSPTSKVILRAGIPLNETYDDTWIFASHIDQYNYFIQTKYNVHGGGGTPSTLDVYSPMTYLRVDNGVIKVKENAENLLNANYLMFTNDSGSEMFDSQKKWYYCFITETPKYISENVTEIHYEIDVMQTYLPNNMVGLVSGKNYLDYELEPCFVEREHTDDDTFGMNTYPENVELGPYVYQEIPFYCHTLMGAARDPFDKAKSAVIVFSSEYVSNASTTPPTLDTNVGGNVDGVLSGVGYRIFDFNNSLDPISDAADYLALFIDANSSESILGVYMIPPVVVGGMATVNGLIEITPYMDVETRVDFFEGLENVRNNKLKCFPYNLLMVTDNNGSSANYKLELFSKDAYDEPIVRFGAITSKLIPPECSIVPRDYAEIDENTVNDYNYTNMLSGIQFPQCSFNIDGFRAWTAQNSITFPAGIAGEAVNGFVGSIENIARGQGFLSGLVSTAVNIGEKMAAREQAKTLPSQAAGKTTGVSLFKTNKMRYSFYRVCIRPEYRNKIDQYFDVFGYTTNRVKVPNIDVRERWCFTKTSNCEISGKIPKDASKKIIDVYNHGVRFWKTETDSGVPIDFMDYSASNSTL